jgi:putative ABC transport system permease protein
MDWKHYVESEFARIGKRVDDSVVEELAQHAAAAWEAARADGGSIEAATEHVRGLISSWCASTAGPRRIAREPLLAAAPSSSSPFAGINLDLRHALRLLRRQPGFATISILMIALGIAATTTIFSVIDGVLLKPLPWTTAARLVRVDERREGGTLNSSSLELTNAVYLAWKEHATTIDGIAGWNVSSAAIESGDGADRVAVSSITPSLFSLLGVTPALGPGFVDGDERRPVVILSHAYWSDHFGGDPNVIGKTVRFSTGARDIVGVMPASFEFLERDILLWTPMDVVPAIVPGSESRTVSLFSVIALLKPGVTPQQAADEAERAARTVPYLGPVIPAVFGADGPAIVRATPLVDAIVGDVRWALWLLLAAVLLLWLAATANVASMQLAHAAARQREVAIRAAIGAGRGRLVRQLLIETLLLSAIGGVAGLAATAGLLRIVPDLLPLDFPRATVIALNWGVVGATGVLIGGASMLVGLLPARMTSRLNVRSALGDEGGATLAAGRLSPARSRSMIIALQVGIAALLLVGAALLGRSFAAQWRIDRGFTSAHVLTARVRLSPSMTVPAARLAAYNDIVARLRARSGVQAAGFSEGIPLGGGERRFASTTREEGQPDKTVSAILRYVSPGYLAAIGMRVSQGRGFTDQDLDAAEPVAIVNRTFANRYLGSDPVGEVLPGTLDNNGAASRKWRVIGIVDDAMRLGVTDAASPEIFVNQAQLEKATGAVTFLTIRTAGDPAQLASDVRAAVRAVDRLATLDQVMTMDARILKSLARPRLYVVLFGGFSAFALIIAIVGLFGGVSYGVTQRTREISVRAALGATPGNIVRLIAFQGLTLALVGVAAGLMAAAASARLLSRFLYGVTTHDVTTYAAVAAVLLTMAGVACAIPARRAARIDPLRGMKS